MKRDAKSHFDLVEERVSKSTAKVDTWNWNDSFGKDDDDIVIKRERERESGQGVNTGVRKRLILDTWKAFEFNYEHNKWMVGTNETNRKAKVKMAKSGRRWVTRTVHTPAAHIRDLSTETDSIDKRNDREWRKRGGKAKEKEEESEDKGNE